MRTLPRFTTAAQTCVGGGLRAMPDQRAGEAGAHHAHLPAPDVDAEA
eukprot:COSAG04_NODE_29781_length_266_cov_1.838323_1_plen_46_part_10